MPLLLLLVYRGRGLAGKLLSLKRGVFLQLTAKENSLSVRRGEIESNDGSIQPDRCRRRKRE